MNPNEGHLVLTRRPMEIVCIGDEIEVEIVRIHGNQVTMVFRAPRTMRVDRKEIRAKILKERQVATGISKDFDEGVRMVTLT